MRDDAVVDVRVQAEHRRLVRLRRRVLRIEVDREGARAGEGVDLPAHFDGTRAKELIEAAYYVVPNLGNFDVWREYANGVGVPHVGPHHLDPARQWSGRGAAPVEHGQVVTRREHPRDAGRADDAGPTDEEDP